MMVIWHNFGPLPGLHRFGQAGALRAGYVGVVVFFVLSGYLITDLLVAEFERAGAVTIGAFYVRRGFRLLPALALALGGLVTLNAVRHVPFHHTVVALAAAIAYVFNLAAAHASPLRPIGGAGWGHLWSLSVEEQFYLAWPLVMVKLARRWTMVAATRILVGLALALTIWRTVLWATGASFDRLYLMTDTRIDAIVIGATLATGIRAAGKRSPDLARRFGGALIPLLVLLATVAYCGSSAETTARPGWLIGPGMLAVSLISALMVWLVVSGGSSIGHRLLSSRLAVAVGRRSYGLYLFHFPVLAWLGARPGAWPESFVVTFVLAELSFRLVETPMSRRLPAWARQKVTRASD